MKTQKQQQAEFERISNAPSPNPRYAGLSVIEATRSLDTSGRNDQRPIQHLILARGGAHPSAKPRKSGSGTDATHGHALRRCLKPWPVCPDAAFANPLVTKAFKIG